jgi:type 1 glutamine amidotransferase
MGDGVDQIGRRGGNMITKRGRSLTICSAWAGLITPVVLAIACGGAAKVDEPNQASGTSGTASTAGHAGSTPTGHEPSAMGGGAATAGSGVGAQPSGGLDGSGGTAETGGSSTLPPGGGAGEGGDGGGSGIGAPYAPRSGPFKMLVYSRFATGGYAHASVTGGQEMLKAIGQTQGFDVTVATDESAITPTGLAQYEIVFFMNPSGEIFNAEQRTSFEEWITKNGAFAGVHSATDTANSWTFYKEMTGQYASGHDVCCASADITWTVQGAGHITAKGLPSPWRRAEEWLAFDKYQVWSTKPGFTILSTVTTNGGGTRPVSYTREWGNFRAFYTSIGHEASTFEDAQVIKHLTAGIMWAVRREASIK